VLPGLNCIHLLPKIASKASFSLHIEFSFLKAVKAMGQQRRGTATIPINAGARFTP
jgi:hypothetical protein